MSTDKTTIHVKNISPQATEKAIKDFFSFCGKINDISVTPASSEPEATLSATITFEQDSAARTALLLDNTLLSGSPINVTASASLDELEQDAHQHGLETEEDPRQEDKPRTAIFAEYLAHGYHIGDKVLQRGIDFDEKNGISSRFRKFLFDLDGKHKVSDKSRAMDTTYGISSTASQGYNTVTRYLDTALKTSTGQQIHKFYLDGKKQAVDIHNEAVRLKKIKEDEAKKCTCESAGSYGTCQCSPGSCGCDGCKKTASEKTAAPIVPEASTSTSEKVTYQ